MYIDEVEMDGKPMVAPIVRLWKNDEKEARSDLLTDLVDLLEARYKIGERIYYHPAKLIVDAMVGRAVVEAFESKNLDSMGMLHHSDDSLLRYLRILQKCSIAKQLSTDISERKLYKRIDKYGEAFFADGGDSSDLANAALADLRDPKKRTLIENELAGWARLPAGHVLIFPLAKKMNSKVAKVMVDWKGDRIPLSKITHPVIEKRLKIVEESHANLWRVHLLVHPDASADARARVSRAFEGTFKSASNRKVALKDLILEKIELEDSFSNYAQSQKRKASEIAASNYVDRTSSYKGSAGSDFEKIVMEYIRDALAEAQQAE